jgi:hypothetical protein
VHKSGSREQFRRPGSGQRYPTGWGRWIGGGNGDRRPLPPNPVLWVKSLGPTLPCAMARIRSMDNGDHDEGPAKGHFLSVVGTLLLDHGNALIARSEGAMKDRVSLLCFESLVNDAGLTFKFLPAGAVEGVKVFAAFQASSAAGDRGDN